MAINRWKGTECSDYLVNLSLFLEGLLFSHYSFYLLSCHLLACACVVADWIALNKTENHRVTFTFGNVLFLNQILDWVPPSHFNGFSSYYVYTCMILIVIGSSDWWQPLINKWWNLVWVYAIRTILCSAVVYLKYNYSKWWLEAVQDDHKRKVCVF